MRHLVVDTGALRATATDLLRIRVELESATTYVQNISDGLGHAGLAAKVSSFTDSWRVHRERLVESMQGLDDYARQLATVFDQTDADLASSVRGDGGAA